MMLVAVEVSTLDASRMGVMVAPVALGVGVGGSGSTRRGKPDRLVTVTWTCWSGEGEAGDGR
jgi:hypothetical protein